MDIIRLERVAFKPYGLSFRGKNAVFPSGFGRAALYRRVAFPFCKGKTLRARGKSGKDGREEGREPPRQDDSLPGYQSRGALSGEDWAKRSTRRAALSASASTPAPPTQPPTQVMTSMRFPGQLPSM